MSAPVEHAPRETRTLQFARFITRNRFPVACFLILSSLFFFYPIGNTIAGAFGIELPGPIVRIDTKARDLFPDHPYIHAQDKFEGFFGNASPVVLEMVVREGTIYTPESLAKLKRLTDALDGLGFDSHVRQRDELRDALEESGIEDIDEIRRRLDRAYPPYPVNHDQTRSLLHRTTQVVEMDPDGGAKFEALAESVPATQAEAEAFERRILEKAPEVYGRLVTSDGSAALVMVQFVTDRLSSTEVYRAVFDHVQGIIDVETDDNHDIYVVGVPIITGWVLHHAWEMLASIGGSVVVIFVLLWAYFRRVHAFSALQLEDEEIESWQR